MLNMLTRCGRWLRGWLWCGLNGERCGSVECPRGCKGKLRPDWDGTGVCLVCGFEDYSKTRDEAVRFGRVRRAVEGDPMFNQDWREGRKA